MLSSRGLGLMRRGQGHSSLYSLSTRKFSDIIGIDLGTTNSCVAVMDGTTPKVIPNEEGHNTTPSVVAFTADGQRLVGVPAKRQAITNLNNTFFATKRLIGRRFDEADIQRDREQLPYKIVRGPNGDAWVEAQGKSFSPQQIGASVLTKMKETAERYLGKPVGEAVITVPAYFNDQQRQATRDAGRIAGLEVRRIVNEPTAAALAFGISNKEDQTIAVYDLGGGTFDVSILQIQNQVFQVLSTHGDTHLGGEDFDNAILDFLMSEFKSQSGIDLKGNQLAIQRLREASEQAKKELDSRTQTEINLPYIVMKDGQPVHLKVTLTKQQFNKIVGPLIQRSDEPCKKAMQDAGMKTSDIRQVLLVGGMTRTPAVQEYVQKVFGRAPSKSVNPDEVVAIGAALQGAVLGGTVKDVVLVDVTPLSLGTSDSEGLFVRIINRNTAIPCKASKKFTTVKDGQTSINVQVLQGEREQARHNKQLGEFVLPNIPPAKRGVPSIEISLEIDANGIVKATAVDNATGTSRGIQIQGSGGLSSAEVERMIKDAERFAEQDKRARDFAELRHKADSLIYSTDQSLNTHTAKISAELTKDITEKSASLKQCLESLSHEELSEAKVKEVQDKLAALEAISYKIGEAVYGRGGAGSGSGSGEGDKKDGEDKQGHTHGGR